MKKKIKSFLVLILSLNFFSILLAQEDANIDKRYKSTEVPTLKILSSNVEKLCNEFLNCKASVVYDVLPLDKFRYELITDEKADADKHILTKTINNFWTIRSHNHLWFVVSSGEAANAKELFVKARKFAENNDYNNCINYSNHAININPLLDLPYFLKAYCHLKNNEVNQFIMNAEKAISINPSNSDYYNQLAWVYATSNNYQFRDPEKALQYSLKAEALYPDNWIILDTLAAAYARNGYFEKARFTQERALNLVKSKQFKTENEKQGALNRIQQRLLLYSRNVAYTEEN